MRKAAKKLLSVLLTVAMLMGSIALMIPAVVIPASADASYTNVPANTTVLVNGINVRYDRYSGNDDGYVHVFEDGTIEFKIRHGDMVWFPDVVMTNSSEVHAEFTVLEGTYQHSGVAYNVASDGAGSWASTMVVGFNNGARVRVSGDTKEHLGADNGGDGYGSGGAKRPINTTVANLNGYYDKVKNVNSEVAVGKTVAVDLKRSDETASDGTYKVNVEWSAVGYGAYHSEKYTDSLDANTSYLYAGGSVGYTVLYQDYRNDYITRRLEKLTVTNCKVTGGTSDRDDRTEIVLAGFVNVTPNTDFVYNGRTYRLDVYSGNTGSYAHILPNGTIDINIRHGDMFWFPGVNMTSSSAVYMEATPLASTYKCFPGMAYAVAADGSGSWATSMVQVVRTAGRVRITAATLSNLATVSGSDRGQGGTTRANNDNLTDAEKSADLFKALVNANSDWLKGKTIGFSISRSDNTVTAKWSNPNWGVYTTKTYNTTSSGDYSYTGSVGFTLVNAESDDYMPYRIERVTVSNCTVGGNSTALWSGIGREMTPHTDTVVDGVTYRFDPLDSHTSSSCWIMDDNSFRVRLQGGDLFWLPGTEKAAGAKMTAKMINNNGQRNNNNLAAGIAYAIDLGANGSWGDSADSLINAHTQTSWRRRTSYSTCGNANNSQTSLGERSGMTMDAGDRSGAYLGFGNRWGINDVIKYDLSISSAGVVKTEFLDSNNVNMTSDWYTLGASAQKVMKGYIGFYSFWEGDSTDRHAMTVDILDVSVVYGVSDTAVSTSLNGKIDLNFKFQAIPYVSSNANLVVTKAGVEVEDTAISGLWNDTENAYYYSIPLCAKEMTDDVNFSVKIGGSVYNGYSFTVNVKQYAEALAASDASWADLMNAMLKYGAASQMQFNHNTNNLAADISGGITYDASSDPSLTADKAITSFIGKVAGTLTLESGTNLNLYILPLDNVGASVTTATAQNSSFEDVDCTLVKNNDYYQVTISDLKAEDLCEVFYITVTVTEANSTTNTVTFTYSPLTWVKAAISSDTATATTKTLAKAIGVYAAEAKKKASKSVVNLAGQVAGEGKVESLRSATDTKIAGIRSSANDTSIIQSGGTVYNYYVSSSTGSDSNSGTDSSHPWKTLAKVNAKLNEGSGKYNIYLKRGDTWRGEYLKTYKTSNVTITTYGSGAKPVIMGSPENGANASKWTEVETNIWRYAGSDSWADVGNIVFNNGESFGRKVVQLYVKNDKGTTLTDYTHPTAGAQSVSFSSYTDLCNDLDFFHDKNFEGGSGATGYLYLYSTSNPGSRFSSIEFSVDQHGIEIYKANNVKVDNICVKYVGGHGIAGNGLNLQNILVENCEFGWIGGSIIDRIDQSSIGTTGVFADERYGNGVEIYGGCNNFRVQNNYIYQCFDAGITQQYNCRSQTDSDHTVNQLNIYYNNNVIENCNYSIEYFISNCPSGNSSYISNFQITNNQMWNAGRGFCETRVIWGRGFSAHIKAQSGSTSCNRFENASNAFVISGNKFIGERDAVFAICSKMSSANSNANPVITNNEIYGNYQGKNKIGAVCNYNTGSDVEIHKVYADFDTNIQSYMNGQIGAAKFSGNTIKFFIPFQ